MNPTATQQLNRQRKAARGEARNPSSDGEAIALALAARQSDGRQALEACIAKKFDDHYQARLSEFLPQLLSIGIDGQLSAIVGLRPAADSDLFLEKYLDCPAEQAISRSFRTPVDRNEIIEIGNLASAVPGITYALFAVLARVLHLAGFRWVACTATLQVEAMLDRMQFPSRVICSADPHRLGEQAASWGNYYASRPQVITGDVQIANGLLRATPALLEVTRQLEAPIARIAADLRGRAG